jgi:C1A family cysteine protease
MSRTIQGYGWRPDLPDHRDFKFSLTMKTPTPVPPKVDLRALMPPIQDQGDLGSCTAHATVALLEHNTITIGQPLEPLSRLFTYYNARAVENSTASDTGAMLRDVISSLAADGVCPETDWPYDPTQFAAKPTDAAYTDAATKKISVYARLNGLDDMLVCLASGHPFVFGFTVYTTFESDQVASTGLLSVPATSESALGGHAVCAVGYDTDAQVLIVRNSWGPTWGQAGHFMMPFDYVTNANLADDFWTVRV